MKERHAAQRMTAHWTKHGTKHDVVDYNDYNMVLHTLKRNQEKYDDLKYFYNRPSTDISLLLDALRHMQVPYPGL